MRGLPGGMQSALTLRALQRVGGELADDAQLPRDAERSRWGGGVRGDCSAVVDDAYGLLDGWTSLAGAGACIGGMCGSGKFC